MLVLPPRHASPRFSGAPVTSASLQSLCLTRDTQYLVLGASVASVTHTSKELSFQVTLAIRHRGDGGGDCGSRGQRC